MANTSDIMKDHAGWILTLLGCLGAAVSWAITHAFGLQSRIKRLEWDSEQHGKALAEETHRRESTECVLFEKLDGIARDVTQTRIDIAAMRNGGGKP